MTAPRQIVPGWTHFITRRTTQRLFVLRPDEKTNAIFEYCLAEAASRHSIVIIGWLVMSNHYHAIVHDPLGKLPAFLEQFHKMVARALNVRWGRSENLWSSEETCVTRLATIEDVLEKLTYVLTNPVAAHLVDRVAHWPGSSSIGYLDGLTKKCERPSEFFSPTGRMPASVELRAAPPPNADAATSQTWTKRVREAVAAREHALAAERMRNRVRVVGRKAVLRRSPYDSPATEEPRRKLRPALACLNGELRTALLKQLKAFRRAYRSALRGFFEAATGIQFPAGTYRLRLWGVPCEPFSSAA